jgi:hypothetical protein
MLRGSTWIRWLSFSIFLSQSWIASKSVCSFCEAMAGLMSTATTAVSSAEVNVVVCGEVGRPAVYSRYNNGHRTLPWDTPSLTDDSSVYSVSSFTRKCLLCK